MNFILFVPYCIGTVTGSIIGVKVSMFIERLLGASADGHLQGSGSGGTDRKKASVSQLSKGYGAGSNKGVKDTRGNN
jgi:hypothetical protein